jgi:hypothetical protein
VVRAHQTLRNARAAEKAIEHGDIPMLMAETAPELEAARALDVFLEKLNSLGRSLGERGAWLKRIVLAGVQLQRSRSAEADPLLALLARWGNLARRGSPFLKAHIEIGEATQDQTDLDLPLENLASGKKPFGILGLGKAEAKRRLDSISLQGQRPASPAEWTAVRDCRRWNADLQAFITDWNTIADRASVVRLNTSWSRSEAARFIVGWGDLVERAGAILVQLNTQREVARRLFPYGIDFEAVFVAWDTTQIREALAANFVRIDAADAKCIRDEIREVSIASEAPFHVAVREIADIIGDPTISDHVLAQRWQRAIVDAQRLDGLRADLVKLDGVAEKILRSGAPEWARMVRTVPHGVVEVLPTSWRGHGRRRISTWGG